MPTSQHATKHFSSQVLSLEGEDYLVSDKIMSLVGDNLKKFQFESMKLPSPKQLSELLKQITAPRGVRKKGSSYAQADERRRIP